MEVLKIEWFRSADSESEGYMEIILDGFFPCKMEKANKVFDLVARWCSEETIAELKEYFIQKIAEVDEEINEIKKIYPETRVGSKAKKDCEVKFKQLKTTITKYQRMLRLLENKTT